LTEVPEHLLERSRQRRAALSGGAAEAAPETAAPSAEASSSSAVAPAASAAAAVPAEPTPPPAPEPVPAYIEAAQSRKKIPVWVLPVVIFLPLWAFLYAGSLSEPEVELEGQLALGATVYQQCAGCHGATGGGGAGRQLNNGEVLLTFPTIEGQLEYVAVGTAGYSGKPYGNPDRPGGAHVGGSYGNMPAFLGTLTPDELLSVIRHEREVIGGEMIPAEQIGPDGELLHSNGEPYINDAGELVDENGELLLGETGYLINPGVGPTESGPVVAMAGP
jgi:mono/diheme cytochrome c family protein